MPYQIRRAEPGDAAEIARVAAATWKAAYAGIIPEDIQARALATWYAVDRIARQAADAGSAFVVATADDGAIAGFAFLQPRPQPPGDVEMWRFYVLPEHQRQGLGRRMIAAALEALGPASRVFVQVEKGNESGRRAYEALGFTFVREYDDDLLGFATRAVELVLTR